MSFGAALYGAESKGPSLMEGLLNLDQARKQMRQQALTSNLIGNYLQQVATMPNGAMAPAPGQASTPSSPNKGTPGAATQAGGESQPSGQPMSLDGLMKFLADRGVTGEDAYATAAQFMPWLSEQDKDNMNKAKLNMDLQKLLIQYGYDQQRAKEAADRIAAYHERTGVMKGRQAEQDRLAGLGKTAMKLTTGKQKLEQQRASIVNNAKNTGRPLTVEEQRAVDEINTRIQSVDNGIMAIRAQQAKMQGVDETQFGDDSILQQDGPNTDYTGGDASGGQ